MDTSKALRRILFIAVLLISETGYCQKMDTKNQKIYTQKTFDFLNYVKNTPFQNLDKKKILKKYIEAPAVQGDTTKDKMIQNRFFNYVLRDLDQVVDTLNLKEWMAVGWNAYSFPEKLPHMLWEAEPFTDLFGHAIQNASNRNREEEIREGEKTLTRTIVIYKKTQPNIPVYFILFDDRTNKIASWLLINQGGFHDWVTF